MKNIGSGFDAAAKANTDASVRAHLLGGGARSFLQKAWRLESSSNGGGGVGLRRFAGQSHVQHLRVS